MPSGGILIHLFAGHIFNLTVLLQFRISLTTRKVQVRDPLVYTILLSPLRQLRRTTHRVWTRYRINQNLDLPRTSYSWISKGRP